MKKYVLLLALFLLSSQVQAQGNGHALLEYCNIAVTDPDTSDPDKSFKVGLCMGSVVGVMQTMAFLLKDSNPNKMAACIPFPTPTNVEALGIVVSFLRDSSPILLEQREFVGIMMAFRDKYPCG